MLGLSAAIGVMSGVIGLVLSFHANVAAGGTIVLVATGVFGLVWLLVFQLASNAIPFLADLGPWNYAIAFAFMITGLLLTMRWR